MLRTSQASTTYPVAVAQGVQAELVCDLGGVHGVGQILLVGEDQQDGVTELVLREHAQKLLASLAHTVSVIAIHDEDETLCVTKSVEDMQEGVCKREG